MVHLMYDRLSQLLNNNVTIIEDEWLRIKIVWFMWILFKKIDVHVWSQRQSSLKVLKYSIHYAKRSTFL